jgi:hypothetical protein
MSEKIKYDLVQLMSPIYYIANSISKLILEMDAKRKYELRIAYEDVRQFEQASYTLEDRIKKMPSELANYEFKELVPVNHRLIKLFHFHSDFLRGPHYKISKDSLKIIAKEYDGILEKLQKSVLEDYWL